MLKKEIKNTIKKAMNTKVIYIIIITSSVIATLFAAVETITIDNLKEEFKTEKAIAIQQCSIRAYEEGYADCQDAEYLDHEHCIQEKDICTMDTDQYDYFRVSIGDVNYNKYKNMMERINYTYVDQEKDIQEKNK